MKNGISAVVLAILAIATQAQTTCVDPLACNFTELGECEFLDDNGMPCVTEGCAIPGACNFDPEADINDGSCEFTSCLGCTDEAACNYDPEAVYLDMSCIYFVDCNGVCGGDWIEDECGNCYEPSAVPTIITFTSCGLEGRIGPSQEACDAEYGGGLVEVIDGFQYWTAPISTTYRIVARGAQGGAAIYSDGQGGLGAEIDLDIFLEEGSVLRLGVGQRGVSHCSGGGGGSSGVSFEDGELIAIAGGGGGAGYDGVLGSPDTQNASISHAGQNTYSGAGLAVGYGGQNGAGGTSGSNPHGDWPKAGGGAGVGGDGEAGGGGGGSMLGPGGFGSTSNCYNSDFADGGFGFTGGGGGEWGGGGGGGFSGGAGGASAAGYVPGGGGGSFISEESVVNSAIGGFWQGSGEIQISFFESFAPDCLLGCVVSTACNFNPEATNDDGSCDFCFCGPGTEYDIELGQCMIVNGSSDINGDGCTNLGDLLDLLSGFGICNE